VLVALTYDGRILLLTDSDGDGLEDRATAFWDRQTLRAPIGMALTPRGSPSGFGAYVASKGKVSLVLDTDGDDVGDREVIVAQGWTELQHGVDSLGVALAPSGEVYFGLGCANFTNAYLIDAATGKAGYRLNSERGTILRVAPDFQLAADRVHRHPIPRRARDSIVTAISFATDQEGETWLPEAIRATSCCRSCPAGTTASRHATRGIYPTSSTSLRSTITARSINRPAASRSTRRWAPAARSAQATSRETRSSPATREAKSIARGSTGWSGEPPLYLARTSIFAALGLLAVETCISPRGDLILAAHSGGP
jgi:hypothetical protein